jgi:hypothetical protein
MTIAQSRNPSGPEKTTITASEIYADILSQLTYELYANSIADIFTTVYSTYTSWELTFTLTHSMPL